LRRLLENKYYFDWFNENVIARASRGLARCCGMPATRPSSMAPREWLGARRRWLAGIVRRVQTGFLYSYASGW